MDLEKLYFVVAENLHKLELSEIWPGFAPLKFALYDAEKCFFDGGYIEKTDAFCANTSTLYNGEQIAIWMVQDKLDGAVLTAKLVHEMFHGFQTLNAWSCWPNEMEALSKYTYSAENLSLKLRENELLLALLERFDEAAYSELLSLKKYRSIRFPYEFTYESKVEQIEGTANYVEWQALRMLDEEKADSLIAQMRSELTDAGRLFPIRISCYSSGALMINAMRSAGEYSFTPVDRPAIIERLSSVAPAALDDGRLPADEARFAEVSHALEQFNAQTRSMVASALEKNELVLSGPLELAAVNIYDARRLDRFITSTYFMMYRDGEGEKLIQGSFVIRLDDDGMIDKVYRMA
ncbi:MAG: hypothetical protein IKI64_02795 [Clostridia bacterium]|nr:hypothetical protein [Clostridia bacterium]